MIRTRIRVLPNVAPLGGVIVPVYGFEEVDRMNSSPESSKSRSWFQSTQAEQVSAE